MRIESEYRVNNADGEESVAAAAGAAVNRAQTYCNNVVRTNTGSLRLV